MIAEADMVTNTIILQLRILAQVATMRSKLSGTLEQQQARCKQYYDRKVRCLPTITVGQNGLYKPAIFNRACGVLINIVRV